MLAKKLTIAELRYQCLHEAGHALASYVAGGHVEFMEVIDNDSSGAKARAARCNFPLDHRQFVACGGFAVEYILFRKNRLVTPGGQPLPEREFIDASMNNACIDKVSFFGGDFVESDGTWPKAMDLEFIEYAQHHLVPEFCRRFGAIEDLASELERKRTVERREIESILGLSEPET